MTVIPKIKLARLAVSSLLILFGNISYAKEILYSISNESFPNPERGWYAYSLLLEDSSYNDLADKGFRLAYAAIVLSNFMNKDIDKTTLNKISARFQEMRTAGIKAVLRVNYNEKDGGNNPGFSQIKRHMQQLAPILNENKDVIAFIEGGYMGPWGEWHLYDVSNPPFPDTVQSWERLIDLLLTNNPEDRFIMIRYPGKKQAIFGGKTITEQNAFTHSAISRIGHHNDCFVSSADDVGTYQLGHSSYSTTITDLKEYLKTDTRFAPMGGETCAQHSRASCSNTLLEMESFRWTYMNRGYHPLVIADWEKEGCFDEIDRRLGYRLSLVNAKVPDNIVSGRSNTITLTVTNNGFARPWYYRTPYIRLIQNNTIVVEIAIKDFDIRNIEANETKTFSINFDAPENITGDVDVALWLPDTKPVNHSNSRYSIRLANKNIWHATHGHNILATKVSMSPDQPNTKTIDSSP